MMLSTENSFPLLCIDATSSDAVSQLENLRKRLSPEGNVVSARGQELTMRVFGKPLSPEQVVQTICTDIRREGTPALLRYSSALDGSSLSSEQIRVPEEMLERAHGQASPSFLQAIRQIRNNIATFQSAILHRDVHLSPSRGVHLQQRYLPLRRIGICVPGGAAAYPSTVLMTAVPAIVAGVSQIAIVAPPTKLGAFNPDVLAVCHELGIKEVYAVGGAQAVAALAYGTDAIPAVDKIVGPGNLFVALAKRHVYGQVDIDSIAGPSEVVIIADQTTRPDFAAADMLAQSEHSPGSSVLISWNQETIDRTLIELQKQVMQLDRSQITIEALLAFGACVLVRDADHACEITDAMAPEHLHIATSHANELVPKIRNAGATFVGPYSPVALGDYAAGPSHVLPTGGTARWASGLTCNHFLRSSSVIEYSDEALSEITPSIVCLADKEGLSAHRQSVTIRQSQAPR